jgi:hypothetical protein
LAFDENFTDLGGNGVIDIIRALPDCYAPWIDRIVP